MTLEGDLLARELGRFQQRLLSSHSWRLEQAVAFAAVQPVEDDPALVSRMTGHATDAGCAAGLSWYAVGELVADLVPQVFLVDGCGAGSAAGPGSGCRCTSWWPVIRGCCRRWLPAAPCRGRGAWPGGPWRTPRAAGRCWWRATTSAGPCWRSRARNDAPSRYPGPDQVMPAADLLAALDREAPKPPKPPRGHRVEILESVDAGEGELAAGTPSYPWTLRDESLHRALGVDHNVEAEELVRDALRSSGVRLDAGVVFDSSGDCFYPYARSTRAAEQLAQLIADLVARRSPAAEGH